MEVCVDEGESGCGDEDSARRAGGIGPIVAELPVADALFDPQAADEPAQLAGGPLRPLQSGEGAGPDQAVRVPAGEGRRLARDAL